MRRRLLLVLAALALLIAGTILLGLPGDGFPPPAVEDSPFRPSADVWDSWDVWYGGPGPWRGYLAISADRRMLARRDLEGRIVVERARGGHIVLMTPPLQDAEVKIREVSLSPHGRYAAIRMSGPRRDGGAWEVFELECGNSIFRSDSGGRFPLFFASTDHLLLLGAELHDLETGGSLTVPDCGVEADGRGFVIRGRGDDSMRFALPGPRISEPMLLGGCAGRLFRAPLRPWLACLVDEERQPTLLETVFGERPPRCALVVIDESRARIVLSTCVDLSMGAIRTFSCDGRALRIEDAENGHRRVRVWREVER